MKRVMYAGLVIMCLVLVAACAPITPVAPQATQPTAAPAQPTSAPAQATAAPAQATSAPAPATTAPTAAAASGTPDKITLVHFGNPEQLPDHPWTKMVEEYNKAHPEVQVELSLVPGAQFFQIFGTQVAAGNPPDVMYATAAGMMQFPGTSDMLVDVAPIIDDEAKKDLGPALAGVTLPNGKIMGFPLSANWGDWACINNDYLKAAGIDWHDIYNKGGWTWEDYDKLLTTMTVDAAGKHPGEAGFDENNVKVWGFGRWRENAPAVLFNMGLNAGIPDANSAQIMPMWGNKFNWTGPKAVEVYREWQNWYQKMKVASPATLALPSDAEVQQLIIQGQIGSTWQFPLTCRTMIRDYNKQIDDGKVQGEKITTEMIILPVPTKPGSASGNINRSALLSVFKQNPYKGDAHTQHALELAKWLMNTENAAKYCEWARCVPPRASAQPLITFLKEDENYREHVKYALAHSVPTFSFGHPMAAKIIAEAILPQLEALAEGSVTPEEADAKVKAAADQLVADWLKTADPATVEFWSKPPEGWPGSNYPDWSIRAQ